MSDTTYPLQPGIIQNGNVTAGRVASWAAPGVIADGGFVAGVAGSIAQTTVPVSHTATGVAGTVTYDNAGVLYLCYGTNLWVKFTGSTSF